MRFHVHPVCAAALLLALAGSVWAQPSITNVQPAQGAWNVAPDVLIQFHVTSATAVNPNSVTCQLTANGTLVPGSLATPSGTATDYLFTYQPTTPLDFEQLVTVTITARDTAGLQTTSSYNFDVAARSFGTNGRVNRTSPTNDKCATAQDAAGNMYAVWES